jgi:hypothetical protein
MDSDKLVRLEAARLAANLGGINTADRLVGEAEKIRVFLNGGKPAEAPRQSAK